MFFIEHLQQLKQKILSIDLSIFSSAVPPDFLLIVYMYSCFPRCDLQPPPLPLQYMVVNLGGSEYVFYRTSTAAEAEDTIYRSIYLLLRCAPWFPIDSLHVLLFSQMRPATTSPAPAVHGCELGGSGSGFMEQQQHLKQQLKQKMLRHSQSMDQQRQISQDSLQHLQKKLANLEQVRRGGDHGKAYWDATVSRLESGEGFLRGLLLGFKPCPILSSWIKYV